MNQPSVKQQSTSLGGGWRPRTWLGIALVLAGAGLVVLHWVEVMRQESLVRQAFFAGLIAAGATAAGTLPALFSRHLAGRLLDGVLGFGAGVMLAASIFSLIVPALDVLESQGAGNWHAAGTVALAVLLGGAVMLVLERCVPHEHFIKGSDGVGSERLKRGWLFVLAIVLHNIPEGVAIGAAFAGGDGVAATSLATGIAIQDIPEGFVVAMALLALGYRRRFALAVGMLSGLVEPVMAMLGASVLVGSPLLLPWGLALSAGAMLFVISHELIPESHRQGHELWATNGLMLGFVLMMLLDTALG